MLAPSPEIQEQMLMLGMAHRPNEVCGIYTRSHLYTLANISPTPEVAYQIDAEEVVQLLKRLQIADTDEFAIWHTHPSGLVGPSSGDMPTKVPGWNYYVVAIPSGEGTIF